DGLEMTVRLAKIDDQYWATFDARAIAPTGGAAANPANQAASGPEAEGQPTQAATASDQDSPATADDPAESDVAEGAAGQGAEEVELEETAPIDPAELGQRLGKWAYQIPEHLFNRLSTARSEFLKGQGSTS
ncbi:MAG: hypothetical protein ACREJ0_12665, partial [Geminicoccaceae bacterium]